MQFTYRVPPTRTRRTILRASFTGPLANAMRVLLFLLLARSVFAALWCEYLLYVRIKAHGVIRCGKQYSPNEPLVPVNWAQFPLPSTTTTPQLALRCNPALIPFLPDDVGDNFSSLIIVDALVRYSAIAGAQPLILPTHPDAELLVTVWIDGKPTASGTVQLNGSAAISFSLSEISPRSEPYSLDCSATLSSPEQKFMSTRTNLTYLPSPPNSIGSITKLDARTGGLLAKQANSQSSYTPIFPIGFFTQFGGYLDKNDSALQVLQSQK